MVRLAMKRLHLVFSERVQVGSHLATRFVGYSCNNRRTVESRIRKESPTTLAPWAWPASSEALKFP